MMEEIKDMLDMLHIPYLVAPYEAEAQCAALEAIGLVDGVITEDSDVFLFGGKTVYRNIFHEKKYVEVLCVPVYVCAVMLLGFSVALLRWICVGVSC